MSVQGFPHHFQRWLLSYIFGPERKLSNDGRVAQTFGGLSDANTLLGSFEEINTAIEGSKGGLQTEGLGAAQHDKQVV